MIIYALVITAALFFLSWNLIEKPKLHFMMAVITTLLFLITVFFAVANFGYHYGMHRINEAPRTQAIMSATPGSSLKTVIYRPMGTNKHSQLIIYRNHQQKIVHTEPDSKVMNRIVHNGRVKRPHLITMTRQWQYRSSMDWFWFKLAKKPAADRVSHVFYVPKSWYVLSVKQSMALKQIVKNRGRQLKRRMNTPQAKQQMRQRADSYVKARLANAIQKNPKMSSVQKKRLAGQAIKEFKAKMKRSSEDALISKALQTAKTIN